ncbi:MAG TPA: hypothetical protein VIC82_14530 [Candidatus Nanopelagicales bacterium]|jgi:hypothetical protein
MNGHRHTADGGPIVLDLGGDVGALVLHTGSEQVGLELEISPIDHPNDRQHVAVHPRNLGDRVVYAAVYPDLVQGDYHIWSPLGDPALAVAITGGRITQADWPS